MPQVNMRRYGFRDLAVGEDEVLLAWPLPGGCRCDQITLNVKINTILSVPAASAWMYGCDGYITRVDDDAGDTIDAIWDLQIPKADNDLNFELAESVNVRPFFEPGEEVTEAITEVMVDAPEKFFERRRFITIVDNMITFDGTSVYWGFDGFSTTVNKKYFVESNSAILLGLASPDMGSDDSNIELLPTGSSIEWVMLKYIDMIVEDMFIWILGLGTPGSGTVPYDDAETFLEGLLSSFNTVDSTAGFQSETLRAHATGNAQIWVPGRVPTAVLHAG